LAYDFNSRVAVGAGQAAMHGCFDFLMCPRHAAARTSCKMITQDSDRMQEQPRQHGGATVPPAIAAWSAPAIVLQLQVAAADTASIGQAFARALDAQIAALERMHGGGHELEGINQHRQCPWREFDAKVQIVTTDEGRVPPMTGASGDTVEGRSVQQPLGGHGCKREPHKRSCTTKRVKWRCTDDLEEKTRRGSIDELSRKSEQHPDSTQPCGLHGSTADKDIGPVCLNAGLPQTVGAEQGTTISSTSIAEDAMVKPEQAADKDEHRSKKDRHLSCWKAPFSADVEHKGKLLTQLDNGTVFGGESGRGVAAEAVGRHSCTAKEGARTGLDNGESQWPVMRLVAAPQGSSHSSQAIPEDTPIHVQHVEPPLVGGQQPLSMSSTPRNVSFMDNDEQQMENPAASGTLNRPFDEPMCKMPMSVQLRSDGAQTSFPLDARPWRVVLSMTFCFGGQCSPYATSFENSLQQHPFFGNFRTYIPSRHCQASCDPRLTTLNHPCRGMLCSCRFPRQMNHDRDGKPTSMSCWRVITRYHQEQCRVSNGFMIQVQEQVGLSDIQKIEAAMAEEAKLKIFRTCTNLLSFDSRSFSTLVARVKAWFDAGCVNLDTENVFVGSKTLRNQPESPL